MVLSGNFYYFSATKVANNDNLDEKSIKFIQNWCYLEMNDFVIILATIIVTRYVCTIMTKHFLANCANVIRSPYGEKHQLTLDLRF
jgi:hypothetical protein